MLSTLEYISDSLRGLKSQNSIYDNSMTFSYIRDAHSVVDTYMVSLLAVRNDVCLKGKVEMFTCQNLHLIITFNYFKRDPYMIGTLVVKRLLWSIPARPPGNDMRQVSLYPV